MTPTLFIEINARIGGFILTGQHVHDEITVKGSEIGPFVGF
jgi:hypothetical protein